MGRLIDEDTWSSLTDAHAGKGLVRTRLAPEAPIDIFAAVEQPGSARLILFGLADRVQAQIIDIPQATGIAVRAVPAAERSVWGWAEVRLTDVRYAAIFTSLASDLIDDIALAKDDIAAINRLADRLRRWEAFLRLVGPEGLGEERRAGLYGELHTLRGHLLPIEKEAGVGTWVGPLGAHQDFQGPGWALEVKTSRKKQPVSIRISGERQLDDLGVAFLGLAHVGLEEKRNSGETLPEIVNSVREILAGSAVAETFEGQLLSAGYLDIHEANYLHEGYAIRFDNLFHVREGFPRITEPDLDNGVGDVAYSVAVPALGDFRAEWMLFTDVLKHAGDHGQPE